jgi:transposase
MALADGNGLPISICIADGNRHDVVLTEQTLDAAFVDELPPRLIGDKAWDSKKHEVTLAEQRELELIAPKRQGQNPSRRKQDGRKLRRAKRRWMVERLFAWLQNFRRLVTRWEHKAENFLGFLQLGCVVILLRQFRRSR